MHQRCRFPAADAPHQDLITLDCCYDVSCMPCSCSCCDANLFLHQTASTRRPRYRLYASHCLFLQAESRRIEGVMYGEYWQGLEAAGFEVHELPLQQLLGQQWEELQPQCTLAHAASEHHEQGAQEADGSRGRVGLLMHPLNAQSAPAVRAWAIHKAQATHLL